MRSAVTFAALMATGVLIVMVYIWSGESIAALIMSIITLFAVVVILEWRPWAQGGTEGLLGGAGTGAGRGPTWLGARRADGRYRTPGRHQGKEADRAVWRSDFDITWDRRGVSGVAVGGRAPKMWAWTQIDDIGQDWCRPGVGVSPDPAEDGEERHEQIALLLDFPSVRNPEEPAQAQVMFGPDQDPDLVVRNLRSAWRDFKVTRSRFFDLSAEERTREMACDFGLDRSELDHIDLTAAESTSPELLYQELRRALLASGELCRLAPDAGFDEVLDAFDQLLDINGAPTLTRIEAEELAAMADGSDRVAADHLAMLHGILDGCAEQRGFRVAFVDHGGEDYLMGLVPADAADDWDGQPIGSGKARVILDVPG